MPDFRNFPFTEIINQFPYNFDLLKIITLLKSFKNLDKATIGVVIDNGELNFDLGLVRINTNFLQFFLSLIQTPRFLSELIGLLKDIEI